jgi:hypothetical protein
MCAGYRFTAVPAFTNFPAPIIFAIPVRRLGSAKWVLRSAFAKASADVMSCKTRRSFSKAGQAQHGEVFCSISADAIPDLLILSLSKDRKWLCKPGFCRAR